MPLHGGDQLFTDRPYVTCVVISGCDPGWKALHVGSRKLWAAWPRHKVGACCVASPLQARGSYPEDRQPDSPPWPCSDDVSTPKEVSSFPPGTVIVGVACGTGDAHTVAVAQDGTVFSWGDGDFGAVASFSHLGLFLLWLPPYFALFSPSHYCAFPLVSNLTQHVR